MILMVVALFYGLLNGSKESQIGVGADLMVMPPGASALVGMSGAPISVKVGDVLRRTPHVSVGCACGLGVQPETSGN